MKLKDFFARNPVFRLDEIISCMERNGQTNSNTQRELMSYHLKAGHIIRIRRGFFASIPISFKPEKFTADPYLIAGRVCKDSVLGYHSALSFYGTAYSIYQDFYFFTKQSMQSFSYQGMEFSPKSFPKKLCTGKQENFLVKIENYQGLDLCVTSLERTVVDCLDKPNFAGGHEEMWRSLSMIQRLDLDKLFEYLTFLENSTLFAKTGFFLEQQKEVLGIDEDYLKFLQGFIPKKAHYFERTKREKGIYIKQWNLIVPEKMYHRLWEEPNESI